MINFKLVKNCISQRGSATSKILSTTKPANFKYQPDKQECHCTKREYLEIIKKIKKDEIIKKIRPEKSSDPPIKLIKNELEKLNNIIESLDDKVEAKEITIERVKMDDGSFRNFKGFRVQHSTHKTPTKGGLRFRLDVTKGETERLAKLMTLKCAAIDIPYGGSHTSVKIDSNEHSEEELKNVTEGLARLLIEQHDLDPSKDVMGPDMGTGAREMAWIANTYAKAKPDHPFKGAVVTGKPDNFGGLSGRAGSSGQGVFYGTREFIRDNEFVEKMINKNRPKEEQWRKDRRSDEFSVEGKKILVQGFGNVGYYAAKFFHKAGAVITGIIEVDGEIYNKKGIDPRDVWNFLHGDGKYDLNDPYGYYSNAGSINSLSTVPCQSVTISEYVKNGTKCKNLATEDSLLYEDCDILLACAKENVITSENADKIKARVISEGANGPITPDADEILRSKGIVVIPDIYLNAGGVFVSYLENYKNRQGMSLDRIKTWAPVRSYDANLGIYDSLVSEVDPPESLIVNYTLEDKMMRGAHSIKKRLGPGDIDLRKAIHIRSLETIVDNKMLSF